MVLQQGPLPRPHNRPGQGTPTTVSGAPAESTPKFCGWVPAKVPSTVVHPVAPHNRFVSKQRVTAYHMAMFHRDTVADGTTITVTKRQCAQSQRFQTGTSSY